MMEKCTQIKKVKAKSARDKEPEFEEFKEQYKFYTSQKKECVKKEKNF